MLKKENKLEVQHIWSVLCRQSILNADTNNISLIDVVDQANFRLPQEVIQKVDTGDTKGFIFPVELEVVSLFKKSNKSQEVSFDYRLRFLTPEGEQTGKVEAGRVTIERQLKNMRVRAKMVEFAVDKRAKSGEYTVVVEIKDTSNDIYFEVARIPLEIELGEVGKK